MTMIASIMATFKVAEGTLMIMTLGFPAWVASFHRPSFCGQGIVLQGMFSHIPIHSHALLHFAGIPEQLLMVGELGFLFLLSDNQA